MRRFMTSVAAITLVLGLASVASAYPTEYTFNNISSNGSWSGIGSQFTVDVTDGTDVFGMNSVLFTIKNVGPTQAYITDVYFQDGTLFSLLNAQAKGSNGVSGFSRGADPGQLPYGLTLSPDFVTTGWFTEDTDKTTHGVGAGDTLVIQFLLQPGKSYGDTLQALYNGVTNPGGSWDAQGHDRGTSGLRIGIYVQDTPTRCDTSTGNSYITALSAVPEPSTLAIAGMGALGFGAHAWRRVRKGKKA